MNFPTFTQTRENPSPLGPMLMAASPQGLCGVWFLDQKHFPPTTALSAIPTATKTASAAAPADPQAWLDQAAQQLTQYFAGRRQHFDLPLDLSTGSAFQQSVWRALLDIDRGQTQSYGALAARVGRPSAARAVGAAVGRNPISIIVPCHRVVGTNGALTGYAGGLDRKVALLQLEGCLL
jgi:methylated-DNA-[protein]-cysteine S-methyltransferase